MSPSATSASPNDELPGVIRTVQELEGRVHYLLHPLREGSLWPSKGARTSKGASSAGTRWVSHFVNINGHGSFLWAQDTVERLAFEPSVPDRRWGTTPNELLAAMRHCGFQFWDETSDTEEHRAAEAAFALAEHLTGVRITPQPLQDTTFICGSAQIQ